MSYPQCQYSHVTWVRRDSAAFIALSEGIKHENTASAAVTAFIENMRDAHKKFIDGLCPDVDLTRLLEAYQNQSGILSTRDFTIPDIPSNPNDPDMSFITDLIEGIAGAASTEIGIGISLYNLVLDLISLFNIKLHLQGLLFNTAPTDLEEIHFEFGDNGMPNMLPLISRIPAAKSIMSPLDKKNYDCVGFVTFGGLGFLSLEGFYITLRADRKKGQRPPPIYCQYYASGKGIAPGDQRDHAPLRNFWQMDNTTGVMMENRSDPDGITAIFCG